MDNNISNSTSNTSNNTNKILKNIILTFILGALTYAWWRVGGYLRRKIEW